jgi:hypothetical protein
MDLMTSNSAVAIVVTYLAEKILVQVKQYFAEKNISEKTLVDARFLL